jgi:hypothetical protein
MSAELASVVFYPQPNGQWPQWVHVVKTADQSIWVNGTKMPEETHPMIEDLLTRFRTLPAHGGGVWLEYLGQH